MADKKKKTRRFGFLEDRRGEAVREATDIVDYTEVDPRDFIDMKGHIESLPTHYATGDDGHPVPLDTRGEVSSRILIKMFWILVRAGLGIWFFLIVLRGTQCGFIEFT